MAATEKIAVSLPKHVAEGARRAVRSGRAKSVSAYVADALEEKVKLDDLSLLLDEMLTASGVPLTAADRREADRALGVSKQASTTCNPCSKRPSATLRLVHVYWRPAKRWPINTFRSRTWKTCCGASRNWTTSSPRSHAAPERMSARSIGSSCAPCLRLRSGAGDPYDKRRHAGSLDGSRRAGRASSAAQ